MAILSERDREAVRQRLESLPARVRLVHFTQSLMCDTCPEARRLLEELAALSDKVELRVLNLHVDREEAARHGIDKVPVTVVESDHGARIRYLGAPLGYEFGTLLETLQMVARGDSGLAPESRQRLAALSGPLQLQVFVTPT
jgi:alkyl hydroperoxide reductase subunit AhpF